MAKPCGFPLYQKCNKTVPKLKNHYFTIGDKLVIPTVCAVTKSVTKVWYINFINY